MKKTLKDIWGITGICLIVLILYILLDIFDVPSHIGIPVERFNWDVASLLLSNLIVIALFAITYRALDKRIIQKEHNQRKVALYMLRGTILGCKEHIKLMKDPHIMVSILKKIDFNKVVKDDPTFNKLLTTPFADHDTIVSFASNGVLSEEEFSDYNGIRTYYNLLVVSFITFHDVDALKLKAETEFNTAISKAEATIKRGNPT